MSGTSTSRGRRRVRREAARQNLQPLVLQTFGAAEQQTGTPDNSGLSEPLNGTTPEVMS